MATKATRKPVPLKRCIVCNKEYGASRCQPLCHCQICRLPFKEHPYCSRCEILIGPSHIEQNIGQIIDGEVVCDTCIQWFRGTQRIRDDD